MPYRETAYFSKSHGDKRISITQHLKGESYLLIFLHFVEDTVMSASTWSNNQVAEIKIMSQYPLPYILMSVESRQVPCFAHCFSTFH